MDHDDQKVGALLALPDVAQEIRQIARVHLVAVAARGAGFEMASEQAEGIRVLDGSGLRPQPAKHLHLVIGQDVDLAQAQRADPGPAGGRAKRPQGLGGRAIGGCDRDEADAALRSFEIGSAAGEPEVLAGAGMHEPGGIQPIRRFAHALQAPVKRMVVGACEHVEAQRCEIVRHGRFAEQRPIAVPAVGVAGEGADIDDGRLQVAAADIRLMEQIHHGRKARQPIAQLGDRARSDAVPRQRQAEWSRDADPQLDLGRTAGRGERTPKAGVGIDGVVVRRRVHAYRRRIVSR